MARGISLDVEPGDNIRYLRFCEIEFGHAFIRAAVTDHRCYQYALFVVQDKQRADQIGGAWTTTGGRAVTSGAVGGERFTPTRHRSRIFF